MKSILKVKGNASQTTTELTVEESELNSTLLEFLRSKGLPIAHNCDGAGSCLTCAFNGDRLSCQIKIGDFLKEEETLSFDYL